MSLAVSQPSALTPNPFMAQIPILPTTPKHSAGPDAELSPEAQDQDQLAKLPVQTKAQVKHDFVKVEQAPSLAAIKQGARIALNQSGDSVKAIQRMLTKAGFGVKDTGVFGPTTQKQLKAFQKSWQVKTTGIVGPTTLNMLEKAQRFSSPLAKSLAATAKSVAMGRGTVGKCYNAVAESIERNLPPFLYGMHAYMAADQLAKHPRFKEIPRPQNMNQLPVGAVVVWAKGYSQSGHISVYLGQGKEASDHIAPQMQQHYGGGGARVFLPV